MERGQFTAAIAIRSTSLQGHPDGINRFDYRLIDPLHVQFSAITGPAMQGGPNALQISGLLKPF